MTQLYYKVLKNTIDNLIDLSETPNKNTYFLCGINEEVIKFFSSTRLFEEIVIEDFEKFHIIKKTKNGLLLNYRGNYIILQRNNRENKINKTPYKFYYDFYNKPLEEFNIIDMNELDDK